MCDTYLDPCEVWSETKHTAAKDHTCDCCAGPIKIGEQYIAHFSVCEGDARSEKLCRACHEVVLEFDKEHGQYTAPSEMPELLERCVEDDGETADQWRQALVGMDKRGGRMELPWKEAP